MSTLDGRLLSPIWIVAQSRIKQSGKGHLRSLKALSPWTFFRSKGGVVQSRSLISKQGENERFRIKTGRLVACNLGTQPPIPVLHISQE